MAIKVGFVSLGCPKNGVDTEVMLSLLNEAGCELVSEDINADVMVINTCAFIQSAKEESIENILDVAWLKKNRDLKGIVVTGCLAQRYADDIEADLPEADVILGVGNEQDIVEAVKVAYEGGKMKKVSPAEELPLGGDRVVTTPQYTAYLKIAEGCDNRCAYCAIPDIRGRFRSREIDDILQEARTLSDMGVKELILIAQDTTRYGLDLYGRYMLSDLLLYLCEDENLKFEWIRLLYCYPDKITDEFISVVKKHSDKIKYIDLPIQHISNKMLSLMNRHGSGDMVREVVAKLRRELPEVTLRTTLIVGFPGETRADFNELAQYVKETRFDRLGVFTYSKEENTPAYSFSGTVSEKEKQFRLDNIMNEQYTVMEDYNRRTIGKTLKVLTEGYDRVAESYFGRSAADSPEIDGKIYFSSPKKIPDGTFVNVKVTDVLDYDLLGEAE